jgi:hypothetical protein
MELVNVGWWSMLVGVTKLDEAPGKRRREPQQQLRELILTTSKFCLPIT